MVGRDGMIEKYMYTTLHINTAKTSSFAPIVIQFADEGMVNSRCLLVMEGGGAEGVTLSMVTHHQSTFRTTHFFETEVVSLDLKTRIQHF